MPAILDQLGVPGDVRLFFEPYYENAGDYLLFPFGDEQEVFSMDLHRVPTAVHPWVAGDGDLAFFSFSAMEAIAFLSCYAYAYPDFHQLRFIATGNYLGELAMSGRKITLLFGRDILGRLADIKLSAALRGKDAALAYCGEERFDIGGHFFAEGKISLNAFEKAAGIRSGIRTCKPKGFNTFLEQLKHQSL
jgi:hypothetical protein